MNNQPTTRRIRVRDLKPGMRLIGFMRDDYTVESVNNCPSSTRGFAVKNTAGINGCFVRHGNTIVTVETP